MIGTSYIEKLIEIDDKLSEYSREMDLVTQYHRYKPKHNYDEHNLIRQEARKELIRLKKEISKRLEI